MDSLFKVRFAQPTPLANRPPLTRARPRLRCFEIRPADRRFAHAQRVRKRVRFQLPHEQLEAHSTIGATLKTALAASFSPATKVVHNTHMAYWRDFCAIAGFAPTSCFSADISLTDTRALTAEANIIGAFLAFVITHPRGRKERNTAAYALQILSTVRSFFCESIGRFPGMTINGLSSGNPRAVITGLRCIAPSCRLSADRYLSSTSGRCERSWTCATINCTGSPGLFG